MANGRYNSTSGYSNTTMSNNRQTRMQTRSTSMTPQRTPQRTPVRASTTPRVMMNQQQRNSQNIENFANINDDFNDVILFGLLGIFFLIFTDYIYKLGRKSY